MPKRFLIDDDVIAKSSRSHRRHRRYAPFKMIMYFFYFIVVVLVLCATVKNRLKRIMHAIICLIGCQSMDSNIITMYNVHIAHTGISQNSIDDVGIQKSWNSHLYMMREDRSCVKRCAKCFHKYLWPRAKQLLSIVNNSKYIIMFYVCLLFLLSWWTSKFAFNTLILRTYVYGLVISSNYVRFCIARLWSVPTNISRRLHI